MKLRTQIARVTLLAALILAVPIIVKAAKTETAGSEQLFLPVIVGGEGNVPIDGLWQEFFFREVGRPAQGCATVDFCQPSPSGNSEFAAPAPWSFMAPVEGATLIVVDVADSGDVLSVFDFGSLIGTTSQAAEGSFCGYDPEECLQDPNMSSGTFALGEGPHRIVIIPVLSPFNAGTGYFRVTSGVSNIIELEIDVEPGSNP